MDSKVLHINDAEKPLPLAVYLSALELHTEHLKNDLTLSTEITSKIIKDKKI